MRKFLLITNDYPPSMGGIAHVLQCICSALPPEHVAVLAQAHPESAEHDARQPYRVYRERYTPGRISALISTLRYALRARRIVAQEHPDLLYFDKPWPLGMIGLVARRLGLPYVVHTYGNEVLEPRHGLIRAIRRAVLRQAECVITISHFTRDVLIGLGVPRERIALIRPKLDVSPFAAPVDVAAFKAAEGIAGRRVLLTVGRLVQRKGIDRVIEALPAIVSAVPELVYVVLGVGPDLERLQKLAEIQGVAERVRFVGDRETAPFYHACDVFIMASRHIVEKGDVEGFGIVYLEANACGKPVVGGRSGGVPDAVVDGETGLLVDPNDVTAIAAAVTRLLDDPDLAGRLGRQGHARVLREFTLARYGEEFASLVLERRPAP